MDSIAQHCKVAVDDGDQEHVEEERWTAGFSSD